MDKTDELFASRIKELYQLSCKHYSVKYTHFLNEKECYEAKRIIGQFCDNYMFFGGVQNAVRKMLGISAENIAVNEDEFPICRLKIIYRKKDILSHRDILGSIMALQIKREAIGDIIVGEGAAYVFCEKNIAEPIKQIKKISRIGVRIEETTDYIEPCAQEFEEINAVVQSFRLDGIVSEAIKKSRSTTSQIIKQTGVQVNYTLINDSSKQIKVGDVFSVKGYGKFIFAESGALTKSGKTHILIKKYV